LPSGPHIEWLTVLDFDEIKIDRIFIANIDDPVKRALLVSVVKGLRGTGKPLVFEGWKRQDSLNSSVLLAPVT
jgi:EAL domain-containing protein (putative c-di-GMP-specific phosphodiesterase class I)